MRQPERWTVNTLCLYAGSVRKKVVNHLGTELWVTCRPEPHNVGGWWRRFKLAWLVFTGEADCVTWDALKARASKEGEGE